MPWLGQGYWSVSRAVGGRKSRRAHLLWSLLNVWAPRAKLFRGTQFEFLGWDNHAVAMCWITRTS